GLAIEFTPENVQQEIPIDLTLCVYRIAQEALQNVIKHSGASRVDLRLIGCDGALSLQVTDNGAGFDPASLGTTGGLGLVSMRERLRPLGGQITIDRQPTGGTRVDVRIRMSAAPPPGSPNNFNAAPTQL